MEQNSDSYNSGNQADSPASSIRGENEHSGNESSRQTRYLQFKHLLLKKIGYCMSIIDTWGVLLSPAQKGSQIPQKHLR